MLLTSSMSLSLPLSCAFTLAANSSGEKVLNAVDFIGIDGNDGIGQMHFQRQQCDGASVMEAFVSGMLVAKGKFQTADEHGSAVIMHIGGDTELSTGLREAAVCRQKQACSQDFAVIQK